MLHKIKELRGKKISALDGGIGQVKDFYFDDGTWAVRYLVVNTGSWLAERLVLLSPHALGSVAEDVLQVKLTRRQIEKSPPIDAHKPVSRQYEISYYGYYGWPAYWEAGAFGTMGGAPVVLPPVGRGDEPRTDVPRKKADSHLQSAQSIHGYQIEASDGTIGHVTDFLINLHTWDVRQVVVETGRWFSGKEIAVAVGKVDRISYPEAKLFVRLTKAAILAAPEYHSPLEHAPRD